MEQKRNYLVLNRQKCEEGNSRGHYSEHEEVVRLQNFGLILNRCKVVRQF